ncbi:MAG: zinc ABC transporter substrate-binding protein [Myxococcales bacterium]|nr:zinc ABC transporter substrate-binding protein [Myxococcales bacterium]
MRSTICALGLALSLVACKDAPEAPRDAAPPSGPLTVAATFFPVAAFARRIAGPKVKVIQPLPADADPSRWTPTDDVVAALQGADLVLANGAGFERWLDAVTLPRARLVRTAEPFRAAWIRRPDAPTHTHGGAAHTHGGLDGHTWLDPLQARQQAAAVRDALIAARPVLKATFEDGFDALAADLDALDAALRALPVKQPLLASHPAYDYLARRYGWTVHNLDLDPEHAPDAAALKALTDARATAPTATILLWESAPTPAVRAAVDAASPGLQHVVFAPVEAVEKPEETDFVAEMHGNVGRLGAALGP